MVVRWWSDKNRTIVGAEVERLRIFFFAVWLPTIRLSPTAADGY